MMDPTPVADPFAWLDSCSEQRLRDLLAEHGLSVADITEPTDVVWAASRPAVVPAPVRDGWLLVRQDDRTAVFAQWMCPTPDGTFVADETRQSVSLDVWRSDFPGWRLCRTEPSADLGRWLFVLQRPDRESYRAAVFQFTPDGADLLARTEDCAVDCFLTLDGTRLGYVVPDARGCPTTLRVRVLPPAGHGDRGDADFTAGAGATGRLRVRRTGHPAYAVVTAGARPYLQVLLVNLTALHRPPVLPRVPRAELCDVTTLDGVPALVEVLADGADEVRLCITALAADPPTQRSQWRLGRLGTAIEATVVNGHLLVRSRDAAGESVHRYDLRRLSTAPVGELLVRTSGQLDLRPNQFPDAAGVVIVERRAGRAPVPHAWNRDTVRVCPLDNARDGEPERRLVRHDTHVDAGGVDVPVSLLFNDDGRGAFTGPVVLFVYGSYGVELSLDRIEEAAVLAAAGCCVGVVHVRGGAGPDGWHDAARGTGKHRSLNDLHAAVRHLRSGQEPGLTVTALAIVAASAGGFLVGAALNAFDDLIDAAVLTNGFLDPLPALLDRNCVIAESDWNEWGNPAESAGAYRALAALCPYRNLRRPPSTRVLLLVSERDRQVSPAQSLKWLHKLRSLGGTADLWYFPSSGHHTMHAGRHVPAAVLSWLVRHLTISDPDADAVRTKLHPQAEPRPTRGEP